MIRQKGAVPILILIAVIGVVGFLAVSSVLPFKDQLLSSIFPKEQSSAATGFPAGFSEIRVATSLSSPTNMEFAPDGRLFINERGGRVKIFKNGVLLPTPFLDISSKVTTAGSERGMMGIAFDPAFATDPNSKYVYLYYANAATVKNRVVRYKVSATNPDLADPASEQVLLDTIASDAGNHNGGSLNFGADGKLYITTGDGGSNRANSQDLNSLSGKVLRINKDGTVPTDNPYFGQSGRRSEIWASGLRNPFTSEVDPQTGVHYINDVGEGTWEEIDELAKGANYGWPTCEGNCSNSGFTNPIHQYGRSVGQSITGGAFYRYTGANAFPTEYQGDYFFSDYGSSNIWHIDQNTRVVTNFASNSNQPVDVKIGPDGALYYIAIGNGSLYQIVAGNVPSPTPTPTPIPGAQTLTFDDISGQGIPLNGEYPAGVIDWGTDKWSLSAPWQQFSTKSISFNGSGITSQSFSVLIAKRLARLDAYNGGTASTTLTLSCSGNTNKVVTVPVNQIMTIDTGWTANCGVVTISSTNGWDTNFDNLVLTDGTTGSPSPSPSPNASPVAVISTPVSGTLYNAGDMINFSGTGTDPEDGTLPASSFNWSVVFHHDTHTHPFYDTIAAGQESGSFQIPNIGEVSDNVWYRIHLFVTDSKGLTGEVTRDVNPRKANITVTTSPPGLTVKVDDQPKIAPYTVTGVVGFIRSIGVDSPQTLSGTTYNFVSWSDAGAMDRHEITTPSTNTTYTAAFQAKPGDIDGNGKVDIFDYNILLTNFGKTGTGIQGDLDGNNKVDIFDYNILLTNFGK